MKIHLLNYLRCPCCQSELQLNRIQTQTVLLSVEACARADAQRIDRSLLEEVVETGVLECTAGCAWYPVINYVPILLDFALPLHSQFRKRYEHLNIHALQCPLPSGTPRPGELQIQTSFTIEWEGLGEDAYTFIFSLEERERHLQAELDWPSFLLDRKPDSPPLRILDIGAGFGLEPIYLHNATGGISRGAEVFGVDLNLSLLRSGTKISRLPFVHTVIASLFAPPFSKHSFDLVYSNGVIHHTYSTEAAFKSIARFRNPDGAIYIWIYACEDFFQMNGKARVQYLVSTLLRPIFARLPRWFQDILLYPLAWRNVRVHRRHFHRGANYTIKNTLHTVRDFWTPRYAHRHRFNEVLRWFSELGLEARPVDPVHVQATMPVPVFGIGVRGISKNNTIET